jgi:hypothetical protein
MTDLEVAISASLQAQAQGAAMTTDSQHEQEILESRLNDIDRRTRTRRIVWGTIAAAAAAVVVAIGARTLSATTAPPPASSPAPRYTSTSFVPTVSFELPQWIRDSASIRSGGTGAELFWRACWDDSCPGVDPSTLLFLDIRSVRLGRASTDVAPITSAQQLLDRLDEMQRLEEVDLSERAPVSVDGHPGTLLTVREKATITDGFACESADGAGCFGLNAGDWDRIVILDYGSQVLLIGASTVATNPELPLIGTQFDQMLTTLRFTKAASPSPSG